MDNKTILTLDTSTINEGDLNDHYNGDIGLFIDDHWGNCNWMDYHGIYVIQDFETGEMFCLKIE